MNNMRKLMEAASILDEYTDVDEDFMRDPEEAHPYTSPELDDAFNDKSPAQPMHIKASIDVPYLYLGAGDTMYIKPTNNYGEVYSEENGLTYSWDLIVDLMMRGAVEQIDEPGAPGEMVPFEEGLEEGDDIVADEQFKDGYRTVISNMLIPNIEGDTLSVKATEYKGSEHSVDCVQITIQQGDGEDAYFLPIDLKTLERIIESVKRAL